MARAAAKNAAQAPKNVYLAPNEKFVSGILPWQREFLRDVDSNPDIMFWYLEVHRRARKTTTVINLLIRECVRFPHTRRIYISPTYSQSRTIVWDDPNMMFSYLPDRKRMSWRANEQRMQIRFANGSVLELHGSEEPDRLRGIDFEDAGIDEAAIVKEEVITTILMPILYQKPGRRLFFMYTPKGINWATQRFDEACCLDSGGVLPDCGRAVKMAPKTYAYRLNAEKSGIIPVEMLEMARKTMPRELYDQEYCCKRITEEEFTLITSEMLMSLPTRIPPEAESFHRKPRIISCDPSMGGDECVIYAFDGLQPRQPICLRTRDTMRIYAELVALGNITGIKDYIVDSIGIGKGILDRLKENDDYNVQEFVASEDGFADTAVANKRAELWWYIRGMVESFRLERPLDPETFRQIPYASKYKVSKTGKIQIKEKAEIKSQLGCSPDRADAWAMGVYGLQRARVYDAKVPLMQRLRGRVFKQPAPIDPMRYC